MPFSLSTAFDVACIIASTAAAGWGTYPPHFAEGGDRDKANKGDTIDRIGLAAPRFMVVHQSVFAAVALWTAQKVCTKGWQGMPEWQRALFYLGNLFIFFGGLGRLECHRELGEYFTFQLAVKTDQKVIDTGLYGYVRHPAYSFTALLGIGYVMTHLGVRPGATQITRTLAALILPVISALVIKRIQDEEPMMRRELGPQYAAYAKKVPFKLVPYVW